MQTGCDSTHITVCAVHVMQVKETRQNRPSSGLPNVCWVCATSVIFHSVYKHVVVVMVTKEMRVSVYNQGRKLHESKISESLKTSFFLNKRLSKNGKYVSI